jgi:hypothetical protein
MACACVWAGESWRAAIAAASGLGDSDLKQLSVCVSVGRQAAVAGECRGSGRRGLQGEWLCLASTDHSPPGVLQ